MTYKVEYIEIAVMVKQFLAWLFLNAKNHATNF